MSFEECCRELRRLAWEYRRGELSVEAWAFGVSYVISTFEDSRSPIPDDPAALAAGADPAPADPTDEHTAEHLGRLPDRDTTSLRAMRAHAA